MSKNVYEMVTDRIIEQLEKWGDGFRPQMKKILGMED